MRKRTIMLLALGAAGLLTVILVLTAATQATPFLPGITVKDDLPNGCIDCHKNTGAGKDTRLNVSLPASVKDHPDITKVVKTLPGDCALCHKAGAKVAALNTILHAVHYAKPAENAFVTVYQGACLACHSLAATGAVTVKSGPRNW